VIDKGSDHSKGSLGRQARPSSPHWIRVLGLILAAMGFAAASGWAAPPPAPDNAGLGSFSKLIWAYLEELCSMGPRNPGSPGYAKMVGRILHIGREQADEVLQYPFTVHGSQGEPVTLADIEFRFAGTEGGQPILIGAHYDTRPFADEEKQEDRRNTPIIGANDGGSGTALLLGLAHYLKDHRFKRPVHLVFFDGEDYGLLHSGQMLLGSAHYASLAAGWEGDQRPRAVIVVDMVADRDLEIFKENYSLESAPWLVDLLHAAAKKGGFSQFKDNSKYSLYDDHYPFFRSGIPAVVLIDFDYPYWHTQEDTLDKCSPESLFAVFSVLVEALKDI